MRVAFYVCYLEFVHVLFVILWRLTTIARTAVYDYVLFCCVSFSAVISEPVELVYQQQQQEHIDFNC